MNKLINGKRYNTETATKCGGADGKVLYRKRTGEYFLADNVSIRPVSYEEAKHWAQQYHVSEKCFAFPAGSTVTTFSLSRKTLEMLKRIAQQRGQTASQVVAELVCDAYQEVENV